MDKQQLPEREQKIESAGRAFGEATRASLAARNDLKGASALEVLAWVRETAEKGILDTDDLQLREHDRRADPRYLVAMMTLSVLANLMYTLSGTATRNWREALIIIALED